MEDSSQNGKPEELTSFTNQSKLPTKSEQPTALPGLKRDVFIRRKKGMPFEEFKKLCVKQFREAGLLTEVEPYSEEEMKQQRKIAQEMEESLMEQYPHWKESTTAPDIETISQAKPTEKDIK